jgi:hypothetical protein
MSITVHFLFNKFPSWRLQRLQKMWKRLSCAGTSPCVLWCIRWGNFVLSSNCSRELGFCVRQRRRPRAAQIRWRPGRFYFRGRQLRSHTFLDHMHNADLLSLGRQEQSWRARDTKRGKSLFAWNDSSASVLLSPTR